MPTIPVFTRDLVVAEDEEDYERLAAHRWRLMTIGGYAQRSRLIAERRDSEDRHTTGAVMHRDVLGLLPVRGRLAADTLVVDHFNGNRLDNRRSNLEVVTHAENIRRGQIKRWERWRAARAA